MQNSFVHGAGGVLSADIAVPDHEREVEFYSKILTTGDNPLWRKDLMNNLGDPIIGLGRRIPEYESLPLQWMPHFQVADVAASAVHSIEMGGKELMHGKDDQGQSQWAVLSDPQGASFGIIPPVPLNSDTPKDKSFGCISWLSLAVPEPNVSKDFYQKVIGWTPKTCDTATSDGIIVRFEMQVDPEVSVAEIIKIDPELSETESVWVIHVMVGDFEESLRRVGQWGGKIIKETAEPKRAIIRDPIGVFFAIQTI